MSRLIRIDKRGAAGDPLEEFPKGNSPWRLKGTLAGPRVAHVPDTIYNRRAALFEAINIGAVASTRSLNRVHLH